MVSTFFCLQVGQGDACAVDDISQGQFGAVELNGVALWWM